MSASDEAIQELLDGVGQSVRLVRLGRRMSQDQHAAAAAVSRVTLGSIEREVHPATVVTHFRLADALDVPLHRLLEPDLMGRRADSGGRRG